VSTSPYKLSLTKYIVVFGERMSENFLMLYLRLVDPSKSPFLRGTLITFPLKKGG
jgi:hypothetical protein